jgi:two-component system KDP operon response regulator KdpE
VSKGNILVVDDDPQIRRMMRITLIAEGFEVTDAKNGAEGLERLRGAKYDLVLLDVNMSGMSGIEVCREIRYASEVGVIMLTVRSSEGDKTKAFDAGADDYVTKPFSFPELTARMRATLRRRGRTSEPECKRMRLGDAERGRAADAQGMGCPPLSRDARQPDRDSSRIASGRVGFRCGRREGIFAGVH